LFDLYGKETADRYLEVVSNPPKKKCGGAWRKNALLFLTSVLVSLPAYSYSQDPRSCADPRTQYPSNPPCQTSPIGNQK
jgi:hypothetical protein